MMRNAFRFDCESIESTLQSLGEIFGMAPNDHCAAFDIDDYYEHYGSQPKLASRLFGRPTPDAEHACYFHATRSLNPQESFTNGLWPLGEMVGRIWADLRSLAERYCDDREWDGFRRSVERNHPGRLASLYRLKAPDSLHWGPYGFLVREVPLTCGRTPWRDY